jgi:hypothetical protein
MSAIAQTLTLYAKNAVCSLTNEPNPANALEAGTCYQRGPPLAREASLLQERALEYKW